MYETFLGPERLNIVSGSGAVVLVSMLLEFSQQARLSLGYGGPVPQIVNQNAYLNTIQEA